MASDITETPPAAHAEHRAAFFRQSGWLMMANILQGMLMYGVHLLARGGRYVPVNEYGIFGALLAVAMLLPTIPLQMVLAQLTAKALATNREHELSGIIRLFWVGISAVWLVAAVVVLLMQGTIVEQWHLSNPAGLWITLGVVLLQLWLPMFWGVLQGQQNFLWLGWSMIINAIGRVSIAALAVLVLHTYAAGMMTGVLAGLIAANLLCLWPTRSLWKLHPQPFDWRSLLAQVLPLMLAFLGFQILFTADTMFVQAYFKEESGFYVSAGTLSRALMWLVLPLASVMFPRLVHSAVKAQKSNLMGIVLLGTAVLAIGGALCMSLIGPFVVQLVYGQKFVAVASSILPWYAFAMVPLALANVLLNDLLARPDSKFAPALCVFGVAVAYLAALTQFHASLVMVLKTLGLANLLLLAVCAWFTRQARAAGSATNLPD